MEKIQPGKFIELTYDLYEVQPDGTDKLVHQVDPSDPENAPLTVWSKVVSLM